MSIRRLASGRYVLELGGYYLGCYESKELAEQTERDLEGTFEPLKRGLLIEQEAIEHAAATALFRVNAEALGKHSAALGRIIQKMEKKHDQA
jgi:hypothetical protein